MSPLWGPPPARLPHPLPIPGTLSPSLVSLSPHFSNLLFPPSLPPSFPSGPLGSLVWPVTDARGPQGVCYPGLRCSDLVSRRSGDLSHPLSHPPMGTGQLGPEPSCVDEVPSLCSLGPADETLTLRRGGHHLWVFLIANESSNTFKVSTGAGDQRHRRNDVTAPSDLARPAPPPPQPPTLPPVWGVHANTPLSLPFSSLPPPLKRLYFPQRAHGAFFLTLAFLSVTVSPEARYVPAACVGRAVRAAGARTCPPGLLPAGVHAVGRLSMLQIKTAFLVRRS